MSGITVTRDEIDEVVNAINNLLAPEPPDPSRSNIHDFVIAIVQTLNPFWVASPVFDFDYQISSLTALCTVLEIAGKPPGDAILLATRVLEAAFPDGSRFGSFALKAVMDVRVKDATGAFVLDGNKFIDIREYEYSANPAHKKALADWMWKTDQSLVVALNAIKSAAEALKERLAATETSGPNRRPF